MKIFDFGDPLNMGNGIVCDKERHPLLIECFVTFYGCIRMIRGAPDSICEPLMVHTMSFLQIITLQFHENIRFWAPSQQGKWS